ncbi:hypothetical protein QTP88_029153 [Uroleucon formosanum]
MKIAGVRNNNMEKSNEFKLVFKIKIGLLEHIHPSQLSEFNKCGKKRNIIDDDPAAYKQLKIDEMNVFHRSYMGFTVHWLNQTTLERTSKGLACRRMYGKHTYDNIAEMIDKVLSEFNIQSKTSLIVTDNAANFVKAFRYNQDEGEEKEEVMRPINISDELENGVGNLFNLTLPQHQRWNSFYDAIKCIVSNLNKIDEVFSITSLQPFSRPRETLFLIEYCKVMQPIAKSLDILQGDKHVSLGYLLPTLTAINKSLKSLSSLNYCTPLINALQKGIEKRFQRYMSSSTCQISSALIPKFKLNWASSEEKISIKEKLVETLKTCAEDADSTYTSSQPLVQNDLSHQNVTEDDDFLLFEDDLQESQNNYDLQKIVSDYLLNHNIKSPEDLPITLKKAYIEYNTAVPSSAHVERLFSAGGQCTYLLLKEIKFVHINIFNFSCSFFANKMCVFFGCGSVVVINLQITLGKIDLQLDEQRRSDVIRYNELIKKNRDVLKRFIDCVCFLAIHELPFRGHNERVNSFNQGNFLGCLNLLSSYDSILNVHLETSKIFRGTSNRIQNDLICSVSNIISTSIESEIKNTNFVAILLDETSNITNLSQLSTTLRYAHHETGEAHERFISFVDVSADRSADGLFKHVIDIVNRYELKHKLVAQTYDGAAVMSGHVGGLQVKVKELYPKVLFVHCFSHSLNLVLSQSTSNIKDCKIFFQTLIGMGSFFIKSSKRTHTLSNFTRKKMPKNAPTRWNFSSRLVNKVHEYNSYFIEFFQHVLDNSNDWDNEAIVLSQGFINFLDSRQTYFLLIVFSKIFSLTDILYEVLQTKRLDILCCVKKIEETKLQNYRLNLFEKLWETVLSDKGDFELQRKIRDPKLEAPRGQPPVRVTKVKCRMCST